MTGSDLTANFAISEKTGVGLAGTEISVELLAASGKTEVDSADSEVAGTDLNVWEMTAVDLNGSSLIHIHILLYSCNIFLIIYDQHL